MSFSGKVRPPAVEADDAMDDEMDVPEVLRRTRSGDPSGEDDMLSSLLLGFAWPVVCSVRYLFVFLVLCSL